MTYEAYKISFHSALITAYSESEISTLFEIFIEYLKDWNSFELRQNLNQEIDAKIEIKLDQIVTELKSGKPYQQILGETEFYGLKFFVNEHVLIPRPETEELIELAIRNIKEKGFHQSVFKILDIGTGSGIIPIILKTYFPKAEISAIDYSENALEMAQRNAAFHDVDINFIHQDYLNEKLSEIYDVIISNPPYIGMNEVAEIADSVKEFEPKMALFSPSSNPLVFYEKIANDCKNHLSDNGLVFLEINQKLGKETLNLFTDVLTERALLKDLSGNDRFVSGWK